VPSMLPKNVELGRFHEMSRPSQEEEDRRWVYVNSGSGSSGSGGGGGGSGSGGVGGGSSSTAGGPDVAGRLSNSIGDYELPPHAVYPHHLHNTYHGQVRHHRTPLNLDPKPLRFTDNPQLYSGLPPASQRRRSSNTSNDSEVT